MNVAVTNCDTLTRCGQKASRQHVPCETARHVGERGRGWREKREEMKEDGKGVVVCFGVLASDGIAVCENEERTWAMAGRNFFRVSARWEEDLVRAFCRLIPVGRCCSTKNR